MIWFYERGTNTRTCETRRALEGDGFELVVTEGGMVRVEVFDEVAALLAREYELLTEWRARGWREIQPGMTTH